MEYHHRAKHENLPAICTRLLDVTKEKGSTWKCPKRRFGKTELQMPIITIGGMRIQQTWCPDNLPITNKKIAPACTNNLTEVIRYALSNGINHFETARLYGTSEMQFADALSGMIERGEVKREDIIVQTKLKPCSTNEEFEKNFQESWRHMQKIEYIDLFSFHGISSEGSLNDTININDGGNMVVAKRLQSEGKIKHIGFSTHGTPLLIRKAIDSGKFDYVNLHYQLLGSYHSSGYPDKEGFGEGNRTNCERCKELDMGVFVISPFDKGGKLYKPTEAVAELTGPMLTPIELTAHHIWNTEGVQTISVGVSQKSDLDEVIHAAFLHDDEVTQSLVTDAEERFRERMAEKLGEDWIDQYWNEMPDMFHPNSKGVAVGHILWLYGLVEAYGMIEFAQERYASLEECSKKWNSKLTFDENTKAANWNFNPGKAYEPGITFNDKKVGLFWRRKGLLHDKQNDKIEAILPIAHGMLSKSRKYTDEEKKAKGWGMAYSLQTMEAFPGEVVTVPGVVVQNLTKGLAGVGGGPKSAKTKGFLKNAKVVRTRYQIPLKE
jgi:predicted aldo/keto reductase-like oxidoreductase